MENSAADADAASQGQPVSEWRAGWRTVVSGAAGTGLGTPLFQITGGLFIIPLQDEFGWSRAQLSIGAVVLVVGAVLQPFAGAFIDRFGARLAAIVGLLLLCIAYPLLSAIPQNLWMYYGAALIIALAGPIASGAPALKGVATWFTKNSGLAFGLVLSGVSISSALALPFLAYVIQNHGWRSGYMTLFALVAFVALPLVLILFRERPASGALPTAQVSPDTAQSGLTLKEAMRDRRFWMMFFALGGAAVPIGGFVAQFQPLLRGEGFTPASAAAVGTVYAISIGLGRVFAGKMLDMFNPSKVAAICLSLAACGALLLVLGAGGGPVWLLAAAAAFFIGLGQGAEIDFNAYFTLRLFGLRNFSVIFGTIILAVNLGLAGGALIFAAMYDKFGNYHPALYTAIVVYLTSAAIMLMVKVPPREKGAPAH
jgi:MFS family permease